MDFIDYLSYLVIDHKEHLETMIILFGPEEIITGLNFGTIVLEESIIRLNIQ